MDLEEEATEYALTKSSSSQFIKTHIRDFIAGANSKWVEVERINSQLELLNMFKRLRDNHGYFGGYDNGQVIDREINERVELLKQLEDEEF